MKHSLSFTPINSRLTTVDWLNLKQTGFPPVRLIGWAHNSTFPIRSPLLPQKHSRVSTRECHSLITIQLPKQPSSSSVLYCYNHMYRTLADPEMFCRLPHGRVIVNDISGNLHSSFLNITFQTKSPAILIFTLYAGLFSYILSLSDVKEDIAVPFINTKTTVSLSKSKKDSLTAEICRITRECLGKGENWVMTGFEDNASLFFQGDSAAVAYVEVKSFGTPSAAGTSQMTGKLCHLLSGELSIPADHIYVAYFPTDNWGWNGSNF